MGHKTADDRSRDSHEDYKDMGYTTVGDYTYYGYKQHRGTEWAIKREHTTTKLCDWVFGEGDWDTAWATPASAGTYATPPDS